MSLIEGLTPEELKALQWAVSYRAQQLPHPELQKAIKAIFRKLRRRGGDRDLQYLQQHPAWLEACQALGHPPEQITSREFEAVMRMRAPGFDGWVSLVKARGEFPTGLVPYVERCLDLRLRISARVRDERERPTTRDLGRPLPELFSYQTEAVAALVAAERGIVVLPPRSGKTRILVAAVMEVGLPAIVLVPKREIAQQVEDAFKQHLPERDVLYLKGKPSSAKLQRQMARALVWVTTPQTAVGRTKGGSGEATLQGLPHAQTRRVLAIDEFHHAAAAMYRECSALYEEAYFRWGLTATDYRADVKNLALEAVLSERVYSRTTEEMLDVGRAVPARIALVRVPGDVGNFDPRTEGIIACPERNELIVRAARALVAEGRRVLIRVRELEHGRILAELIPGAVNVAGGDDVRGTLKALEARRVSVVIGTSVIGEGVDVPGADAMVYASGGKSSVGVVQDYWRVLTASQGKSEGVIVDLADIHHERLADHSAQRLAIYRREKSFSSVVINPEDLEGWIHDACR